MGTFVAKMDSELNPRFPRCVLPIFQEKYHAMVLGGTGTLFTIGGEHFLFTASHVLDAHKLGLGLYVPRPNNTLVQLEGDSLKEQTLDIAVFAPEVRT